MKKFITNKVSNCTLFCSITATTTTIIKSKSDSSPKRSMCIKISNYDPRISKTKDAIRDSHLKQNCPRVTSLVSKFDTESETRKPDQTHCRGVNRSCPL